MLCDTTGLTSDDVGFTDVVQQGGLTVVNMSHDGNNGMTRLQILGIVLFRHSALLVYIGTDKLHLEAVFIG